MVQTSAISSLSAEINFLYLESIVDYYIDQLFQFYYVSCAITASIQTSLISGVASLEFLTHGFCHSNMRPFSLSTYDNYTFSFSETFNEASIMIDQAKKLHHLLSLERFNDSLHFSIARTTVYSLNIADISKRRHVFVTQVDLQRL
jgi:hypothetical protein